MVEITNDKLIQIWNVLSEVGKVKENVKFSYAVARNKNIVEAHIKSLTEAQKQTDGFREYDKKRLDICKNYAIKDDTGPVMANGEFVIPQDDRPAFDKEITILQKEYKKVIDEQKKNIDDFNELIKETTNIDFYRIKIDCIPEKIEGNYLELMMPFIDGEPANV